MIEIFRVLSYYYLRTDRPATRRISQFESNNRVKKNEKKLEKFSGAEEEMLLAVLYTASGVV